MARMMSKETLDAKIKKAEEKTIRLGKQYDAACKELKELRAKRDAIRNDELIEAFTKSGKTYDEVLKFLRSRSGNEETDRNEKRRR